MSEGADETHLDASEMRDLGRVPEYTWHVPAAESGDGNVALYSVIALPTPNGACYALCAGGDETVRLLELRADGEIQVVSSFLDDAKIHSDSIIKLALSPDSKLLAAAGMDGLISLYTLHWSEDGKMTILHDRNLEGPEKEIEDIAWLPNRGRVLMAASADGTAWLWNADTGDFLSVFNGHKMKINSCAFVRLSPVEAVVCVTAGADGLLIVWDPKTGLARHKLDICSEPSDKLGECGEESVGILSIDVHPVSLAAGIVPVHSLAVSNFVLDLSDGPDCGGGLCGWHSAFSERCKGCHCCQKEDV